MSNSTTVIDLIIPGLVDIPTHELDELELRDSIPHLNKLLRFSSKKANTVTDFDLAIIQRLGIGIDHLPYAEACGEKGNPNQLLFKPVFLKSDMNNAVVFPIEIDDDELSFIINDLNNYFKEDCDIKEIKNNTWLMQLKDCAPIIGTPHYLSAMGKKVTHYLEQSKADISWFKLTNEIQMFLYQHEINQKRLQTGLPIINSLWFWGAGCLNSERQIDHRWFSDEYELSQLGQMLTGNSGTLSDAGQEELTQSTTIVDLSILKALKTGSHINLNQLLIDMEDTYLKNIMSQQGITIRLNACSDFSYIYQPLMAYKFWKPAITFKGFCISK